jgi:hypothetical protein
MVDFSRDPIINVVHNGIKQGIRVALENECYAAAVILIYSGIDTMSYLNMPLNKQDVTKSDFITWVDNYMKFPGREQLTGLDIYGARCGMLHMYSAFSRLSREGKCRNIGYMDNADPPVIYNPNVNKDLVLVAVPALAEAFFAGVNEFLIDLFADKKKGGMAEKRFKNLVHYIPIQNNS